MALTWGKENGGGGGGEVGGELKKPLKDNILKSHQREALLHERDTLVLCASTYSEIIGL